MEKNFSTINEGDTIFFTKISNSKIFLTTEGMVFKTKVSKIIRTCDTTRASIAFEQPINGKRSITVELNKPTHVSYNSKDEINLNADVFGITKEITLNATNDVINARIRQINNIKNICDDNIDDLLIAELAIELEQEKNNEMTLEEAASMAL